MKFHEALLLIILLILGFFAADAMGWLPRQAVAGQPQPQVIYVPMPDTAVPDIAPGMATAVMPSPVPDTIIIQAPATWTPAPLPAAAEADCKITQTCPTVKNK